MKLGMHENLQEVPPAKYLLFGSVEARPVSNRVQNILGLKFGLFFLRQIEKFPCHFKNTSDLRSDDSERRLTVVMAARDSRLTSGAVADISLSLSVDNETRDVEARPIANQSSDSIAVPSRVPEIPPRIPGPESENFGSVRVEQPDCSGFRPGKGGNWHTEQSEPSIRPSPFLNLTTVFEEIVRPGVALLPPPAAGSAPVGVEPVDRVAGEEEEGGGEGSEGGGEEEGETVGFSRRAVLDDGGRRRRRDSPSRFPSALQSFWHDVRNGSTADSFNSFRWRGAIGRGERRSTAV
ncbi:ARM repeat superfamily protein [Striga asiatica]|uniref:ARM repeat superfamily protein n=1 Tax=Striga asiatica TaxID=4170 RepID=A0A5A7RD76_STRAF|nr:ARM repeat superfamily protein [Striga asiatica]